jgi:N-acetylglucosaminyl-diphospho-decaprenol L-rhamnosyltransferase
MNKRQVRGAAPHMGISIDSNRRFLVARTYLRRRTSSPFCCRSRTTIPPGRIEGRSLLDRLGRCVTSPAHTSIAVAKSGNYGIGVNDTRVDVVVVSYNSSAKLRRCVEPLAGHDDVHVIVVDNASPDHSADVVADLPLTLIRLRTNRGFAHGCNVGLNAGAARYVLFLNPDAEITVESILVLANVLEANERIGAVAPRIVEADGALDFSQRRFPRVRSTLSQAFFLHRVFPRASWTDEVVRNVELYEEPHPVDWVSGACVLVRRAIAEQLNGFDEGFFMYCEDKDLCRRIWTAGYEVRFEPSATAVHIGGVSAPRSKLLPVMAASRIRYARKHFPKARALLERLAVMLLALTHMIVSRGGRSRRAGHTAALLVAMGVRTPTHPPSA